MIAPQWSKSTNELVEFEQVVPRAWHVGAQGESFNSSPAFERSR